MATHEGVKWMHNGIGSHFGFVIKVSPFMENSCKHDPLLPTINEFYVSWNLFHISNNVSKEFYIYYLVQK